MKIKIFNFLDNNNDKIVQIPELDNVPDPRGLGYLFFTNMEKHKDKIAQVNLIIREYLI